MNEYIKSDLYRYYENHRMSTFIKALLKNRGFRHMVGVRLAQNKGYTGVVGKFLYKLLRSKHIQLSYKTKIGFGLYIGHGGPIVINETTVIGNNVNLSQFTTIGSNTNQAAIIGDNTYIGPNVCIVENIIIGTNVTIGAGSVVTKDIPNNATAAGNYAKVLNFDNPGIFVKNRWEMKSGS